MMVIGYPEFIKASEIPDGCRPKYIATIFTHKRKYPFSHAFNFLRGFFLSVRHG